MIERTDVPTDRHARHAFLLRIGERPGGWPLAIPVLAANGSVDGPTLVVCGALHGGGVLGSLVVTRAWRELDVGALEGTYIGLPSVNPAAIETRTRNNIMETYPGPLDMNRCFPGSPAGTMTERIAAEITGRFVGHGEWVLDLHTVARGGEWLPYASVPRRRAPEDASGEDEISARSRQMGLTFGTDLVVEQLPHGGSLVEAARNSGSPAVSVEFGIPDRITSHDIALGLTGISRVLAGLGMTSSPLPAPSRPMVVRELYRVTCSRGGYLDLAVELGEPVQSGQPLGVVLDMEGVAIEYLLAPADGWVCRLSTMGSVSTGDVALVVGCGRGSE